MTRKSALVYVIGFFCFYVIALFSAITESIPFIIIACSVLIGFAIYTVYLTKKYGTQEYNKAG